MGRVVVETCLRLDIREINRLGWRFGWQFLTYTSGASVQFLGTPRRT